jgi:ribose transport system substrate-binding protein
MKELSTEETLQQTALSMTDPFARGVFLKLCAAAGASLAVPGFASAGRQVGPSAQSHLYTTGPVGAQFGTLKNLFFHTFRDRGLMPSGRAFKMSVNNLIHDYDSTKELAQARTLIAKGMKAVVDVPSTAGVVPQKARLFSQAGVTYLTGYENPSWFTQPDIGSQKYLGLMTPDWVPEAYQPAKILFKAIGGEGTVIHLKGQPGGLASRRTRGAQLAAKEFPGIKLVGMDSGWDPITPRAVFLNLLEKYPDAKAVYCANDNIVLAVLSVLRERKNKKILVGAAGDGIPETLPELRKGDNFIVMTGMGGPWFGGYAIVKLFDALNGVKLTTPETLLTSRGIVLTPDNVDTWRKVMYENPKPFNWTKMSRFLHPKDWDTQFWVRPADPEVFWKGEPPTLKLNPVWKKLRASGEIKKAQALYASHYKSGPVHRLKVPTSPE